MSQFCLAKAVTNPSLFALLQALLRPDIGWRYIFGHQITIQTISPAQALVSDPNLNIHVVAVCLPHETLHLAVMTAEQGGSRTICDLYQVCGQSYRLVDPPELFYLDVQPRQADQAHSSTILYLTQILAAMDLEAEIPRVAGHLSLAA